MSVSVVIQSLACVTRCFAGSSGSSAASAYIENAWPSGKRRFSPCTSNQSPARWLQTIGRSVAIDLHAQVVQLKVVVHQL